MALTFSVISPERSSEIINFLANVFGISDLPPNFSPECQAWKYFAPHPWWPTARSYVLETESGIASHGCVSPVRFAAGDAILGSMVIIDWASGKLIPGSGLFLYRQCMEVQNCSLLAIGGSTDTLRILPQARWFVPKGDLRWYAKSLRPWGRFLRSSRRLRDWLKFGRNMLWRLFPLLPAPQGWTCRPARQDDPVFTPAGDFVPILRTRAWIDYLCACPVANCKLWTLQYDGEPRGHALVANIGGSARVADFALGGNQDQESMTHAFSALVRALATQNDILEVVASSSLTKDVCAFQECGLRYRGSYPVLLADKYKTFPPEARLEIKPIVGDSFYLYDSSHPFQL